MVGYGGINEYVNLASNEIITSANVGYANLDFGNDGFGLALCYLQFTSNLNSYGPYDPGCSGTQTSYYNLSSGLAYFNGSAGWCINVMTFHYYV